MKRRHPEPRYTLHEETARLARKAEEQVGEDNVRPWLRVHVTLFQAATQGYRIGLHQAKAYARQYRN